MTTLSKKIPHIYRSPSDLRALAGFVPTLSGYGSG